MKKDPKCSRKKSMHCVKDGEKTDDSGSNYVKMLEENVKKNGGFE
jgi:hypothetical protein